MARIVGRRLSRLEGCFVQGSAIAVVLFLIWAAFSSGLIAAVVTEVGRWVAGQMRFGPTPSP